MDAVSSTLCAARRSSCAAAARRCSRHNPNNPLPVAPLAALLLLLLVAGNLSTVRSTFLCCTPDQISNNTPGCGSLVASAANNATDCNAINDVVTAFGVSLTFAAPGAAFDLCSTNQYVWRCNTTTGRVSQLNLYSGGALPASIGNLDALTYLGSSTDATLVGTIPDEVGQLTNLQVLSFGGSYYYASQLSGSLPASLSALTALRVIDLSGNILSGTIPSAFFAGMTHLQSVDLHGGNNFTGALPPSLLNLSSIIHVDIGQNAFTGLLPATNAPLLLYLNARDNSFSGPLSDAFLAGVTSLKGLYLDNNQLSGTLPDLSVLTALSSVQASSFTTDVTYSNGNVAFTPNAFRLQRSNINGGAAAYTPFLDLSRNLFSGAVNMSKLPYHGQPIMSSFKGTDLSNNALSFSGYSCNATGTSIYLYRNTVLHPQAGFGVTGDTVTVSTYAGLRQALTLINGSSLNPCNRGITTIVLTSSLNFDAPIVVGGDPFISQPYYLNPVAFTYGPYGKGYTSYVNGYPMQAVWYDSALFDNSGASTGYSCSESTSYSSLSVSDDPARCLLSASRSVTIVGACSPGPCVLDARGAGRHFEVYASGLRLQNLLLVNGASPVDASGNYLQYQISVGTYQPQTLWGGGCIFADASSVVEVDNCTFSGGNRATQPGGGAIASLAMNPLSVTVVNCVFLNNSADGQGGAIYTRGGAQLVNATFRDNTASAGGAVAAMLGVNATGCAFNGNVANAGGGGAVVVPPVESTYTGLRYYRPRIIDRWLLPRIQPDSTLSGSNLTSNNALFAVGGDGGHGGALYLPTGSLVYLANSSFSNNVALLAGGAISGDGVNDSGSFFGANAVLTSVPDSCSAYGGGAIALNGYRGLSLRGTHFNANAGGTQGGAILASYQAPSGLNSQTWTSVVIQDANFSGNWASSGGGGAMVLIKANATLNGVTCANNAANLLAGVGGCLNALQLGGLSITGGAFPNNTAGYGGAVGTSCGIACEGSTVGCSSTVSVYGTTFSDNAAVTQGGAIYVRGGSLMMQSATLSGNSVSGVVAQGGALFMAPFFFAQGVVVTTANATGLVLSNTSFVGNFVRLSPPNSLPSELFNEVSAAGSGGALFLLSQGQAIPWVVTNGTSMARNSAVSGGAAYVYGEVNATLSYATFLNNTASAAGGALFMAAGGAALSANVMAVKFVGNAAASAGGAVALNPGATLRATSSFFANNTAADGAVISLSINGIGCLVPAPSASLLDATATANVATRAGGLFFTDAPNASVAPSATCSGVCTGNSAPNGADGYAAVPVSHRCSLTAVPVTPAMSGALLPAFNVTLIDSLGNPVMAAPDLTVTVTSNGTAALNGAATVTYLGGVATFNILTLTAAPGTVLQLTWSLSSASLSLINGQSGNALAVMQPCGSGAIFDSLSLKCVCATGYFLNATTAPPQSRCDPCPSGSYTSTQGQLTCILNPPGLVSTPHTTFTSSLTMAGISAASFGMVQNVTLTRSIAATLNSTFEDVTVTSVADVTTSGGRRLTATVLQAGFTVTATGTGQASAVAAAFDSTAVFTQTLAALIAAFKDPVLSTVPASSLGVTTPVSSTIFTGAEPCPAGTRLDPAAAACVSCPFGQVAPQAGSTTCTACTSRTVWINASVACAPCSNNAVTSPNSPAVCACAPGFYDALFGASATSPQCTVCPMGGVCTSGFLAAQEGWWRESKVSPVLYKCLQGNCLQENVTGPLTVLPSGSPLGIAPALSNSTAPDNCFPGNTGPICSLCLPGYALQSGECLPCQPDAAFNSWRPGSKTALLVVTSGVGLVILTFAFFQPLSPRLQRIWARIVDAITLVWKKLQALPARCLPGSHGNSKATDAEGTQKTKAPGQTPDDVVTSGTALDAAALHVSAAEASAAVKEARASSSVAMLSATSSARMAASVIGELADDAEDDSDDDDVQGSTGAMLGLLGYLEHLLDKVQKYAKIVINFYQIVSTFIKTLDIPWPTVFTATMGKVSVINLNLVHLPKAACLNPNPRYYDEFNGYTLGLLFALLAIAAMWVVGRYLVAPLSLRGLEAQEVQNRRQMFSSTVLQRTLILLYLVYPGVSVVIFGIFTCTAIGPASFLNLDMGIQCYDATWWRYAGGAVVWLFLVPVGVPLFFNKLLRRFRVPDMAALLEDNAWLREAAEHTWRLGMPQPAVDMQRLCVDTIDGAHLAMLHAVLLKNADASDAADILAGRAPKGSSSEASPDEETAAPGAAPGELTLQAVMSRVAALKRKIAVLARPALATENPIQGDAGRTAMLGQLLGWCRHGGVLSIGKIAWDDDLGLPAAPPAEGKPLYPHASGIHSHEVPELLKRASVECGFLFAVYTTRCWYWESVELLRKLILTSILALVSPGSAGQVVVGCLVAFVALLGNIKLKPYADESLNFVNQVAQCNLFFFLFVALLLKVDLDGDNTARYFTGIVGCLTLVPVVVPVALTVYIRIGGFSHEEAQDAKDAAEESKFE